MLGLFTWRRELSGKTKFEPARRLMSLAGKVKSDFQDVRFAGIFAREYVGREKKKDESSEESKVLDEWYARGKRLEPFGSHLIESQLSTQGLSL